MRVADAISRAVRALPPLDRAFLWCAVPLSACAIAPIWASRFLPLLDDPNHLSAIYIWRQLFNANSPLHEYYTRAFAPVSYLLHYVLAWLLSFVVGVEIAHKVVLSLYVLSFPCAAFFWCRASDRSAWLSFCTVPLAYSVTWAHGYHAFDAGIAACLFAITTQDRLLDQPRFKSWAVATLVMLVCYFGHPLTLATAWLCTVVLWDARRPSLSAIGLSIVSLLPSLLFYRWEEKATAVAPSPGRLRAVLGADFPVLEPTVWRARVLDFVDHAVSPLPGSPHTRVFHVVLAGALLLLVLGALKRASYRALALVAVLLALYFVLPDHFNEPVYVWIARGRLAPLIAFFFLLSPAISERHWARPIAAVLAFVAATIPLEIARAYRPFAQQMQGMVEVLKACPANAQVLTLRPGGSDVPPAGFLVPALRQLPSWVQVVHGGYNPSAFPRPVPFPFATKKQLPAPEWRAHEFYQPFLDPTIFGCVLTHNLPALGDERYQLARRSGEFALFVPAPPVADVAQSAGTNTAAAAQLGAPDRDAATPPSPPEIERSPALP
jgi:hypothetical protein